MIAGLLEKAWRNDLSEISLDNQDFLSALILDLYTLETDVPVSIETSSVGIDLVTNKSTSSTSFVAVANSSFNHNFTKPKALIRCSDITASSAAAEFATIGLVLDAMSPVAAQEAIVEGATIRTVSVSQVYESIPAGTKAISLQWKVSGASAAMSSAVLLHYEIIEYD